VFHSHADSPVHASAIIWKPQTVLDRKMVLWYDTKCWFHGYQKPNMFPTGNMFCLWTKEQLRSQTHLIETWCDNCVNPTTLYFLTPTFHVARFFWTSKPWIGIHMFYVFLDRSIPVFLCGFLCKWLIFNISACAQPVFVQVLIKITVSSIHVQVVCPFCDVTS